MLGRFVNTAMLILYLDQKKWIDLARAFKYPEQHTEHRDVLDALVEAAKADRLAIPLTQGNIYETHKVMNPTRRHDLAYVQAALSQGLVFRGRHKRLEVEIIDAMRSIFDLAPISRAARWFLSNVFLEATLEYDDPRLEGAVSPVVVDAIKSDPPRFLYDYLMDAIDDMRRTGTKNFSDGIGGVRRALEERRKRDAGQSLSMRRRIYSAMLITNELDLILSSSKMAGLPTNDEMEILKTCAPTLASNVPTYFVERELSLKLESYTRPVEENDFGDMATFVA